MLTAAWCAASSVIQCRVFFCVSSHGHPFHLIGRVARLGPARVRLAIRSAGRRGWGWLIRPCWPGGPHSSTGVEVLTREEGL